MNNEQPESIITRIEADGKVTEEEYKLFRELQEMVSTAAIINVGAGLEKI